MINYEKGVFNQKIKEKEEIDEVNDEVNDEEVDILEGIITERMPSNYQESFHMLFDNFEDIQTVDKLNVLSVLKKHGTIKYKIISSRIFTKFKKFLIENIKDLFDNDANETLPVNTMSSNSYNILIKTLHMTNWESFESLYKVHTIYDSENKIPEKLEIIKYIEEFFLMNEDSFDLD